ncbi:MAG TPA: hypothetical protein VFM18_17120 [Methanosarcina sp.]|nr:hypothetical protein [Methanosarcina sp.]
MGTGVKKVKCKVPHEYYDYAGLTAIGAEEHAGAYFDVDQSLDTFDDAYYWLVTIPVDHIPIAILKYNVIVEEDYGH